MNALLFFFSHVLGLQARQVRREIRKSRKYRNDLFKNSFDEMHAFSAFEWLSDSRRWRFASGGLDRCDYRRSVIRSDVQDHTYLRVWSLAQR